MNVIVRCDASWQIGAGHVMRCMTLATALKATGAKAFFFSRNAPGNLFQLIEKVGFPLYKLPEMGSIPVTESQDADQCLQLLRDCETEVDWLLVDHYGLGRDWERSMRHAAKKILVLDDLADRMHDCDVLVDDNLTHNMETRYLELVPQHTLLLTGPKYAMLREEFKRLRHRTVVPREQVTRILVSFGGSDFTNETEKVLEALQSLKRPDICMDVIVGSNNPRKDKIENMCRAMNHVTYYCQVDYIAELMAEADLAIGAAGATTWERCCLGLPSIVTIVASNQEELALSLAHEGAIVNLGYSHNVKAQDYAAKILEMMEDTEALKRLSYRSSRIVDACGVDRIIDSLTHASRSF